MVFDVFDNDPHRDRTVIQFSDNRVVRGFVALARSTGGAFWTKEDLQREAATAPVVQVTGNVLDFWARVVGARCDPHRQPQPDADRVPRVEPHEQVANMPDPTEF